VALRRECRHEEVSRLPAPRRRGDGANVADASYQTLHSGQTYASLTRSPGVRDRRPTPCTPTSCAAGSPGARPPPWTHWWGSNTSSSTSATSVKAGCGLLGQHHDARRPWVFRFAHIDGLIAADRAVYARLPKIHCDESRTQGLDRLELIRFLQVTAPARTTRRRRPGSTCAVRPGTTRSPPRTSTSGRSPDFGT
jgi:hypothetical protein